MLSCSVKFQKGVLVLFLFSPFSHFLNLMCFLAVFLECFLSAELFGKVSERCC